MKFIVKILETRLRETELVIDASNCDEAEYLASAAAKNDAGWQVVYLTRKVSGIEIARMQDVRTSTDPDALV